MKRFSLFRTREQLKLRLAMVPLALLVVMAGACSEPDFTNNGEVDTGDTQPDSTSDAEADTEDAQPDVSTDAFDGEIREDGDDQDVSACPQVCSGAAPLCDEGSGECVSCFSSEDCGEANVCTDAGECVACVDDDDCVDGICVLGEASGGNRCAECRANENCTNAAASRCSGEHMCESCSEDADCAHLPETKSCLEDVDGARCVECMTDDDCTSGVCNLLEYSCTEFSTSSAGECEACVSNSHCEPDFDCVPMQFQGDHHGYYCLESAGQCEAPYTTVASRETLGGEQGDYCLLNESATTCEAYFDFLDLSDDQCSSGGSLDDSLCGAPSVEDGLCRDFGGTFTAKCTYRCESDEECDAAFNLTCGNAKIGDTGPEYCGGGM